MATSSDCLVCGVADDTWDHAILHCTMSRCVWALMDDEITDAIASIQIADPKQRIFFPGKVANLLAKCFSEQWIIVESRIKPEK